MVPSCLDRSPVAATERRKTGEADAPSIATVHTANFETIIATKMFSYRSRAELPHLTIRLGCDLWCVGCSQGSPTRIAVVQDGKV